MSLPPPCPQCWHSLQLRITISRYNPCVRPLSAGNSEDVTSFCEGFCSLGMWRHLVASRKNGDLNFIALKPSKLSTSYHPLKIKLFYNCAFIFPFQYQAKYFLPPSVTDLPNNSGSPLLSTRIKNSIMWRTHWVVLRIETVWVKWKEFAVRNGGMEGRGRLCTLYVTKHVSVWWRYFWNKMFWWLGSSVLP